MFETIKDQQNILNFLINSRDKNRLSHAYIFSGPKGVGKLDMAYYFMLMLYCEEDRPCLKCSNCSEIINNEHLNFYVVEPTGNTIKKEQIVKLQEEFSKTSLVEGPRVYVINGIDKMSISAENSLLKFIEEPNAKNTYAILLTENINKLLPTIISRCQVINFNSISKKTIVEQLVKEDFEKTNANILACLANNPYLAKKMYEEDKNLEEMLAIFNSFLEVDSYKAATLFIIKYSKILYERKYLEYFFTLLINLYEDLLVIDLDSKNLNLFEFNVKIKKYKKKYSQTQISENLKNILELNDKLSYNVIPKNVINLLMSTLY